MLGDLALWEQRANDKRSQERKKNKKRLQGDLIHQTLPKSDEERIEANNEHKEYNILPLFGISSKSCGQNLVYIRIE